MWKILKSNQILAMGINVEFSKGHYVVKLELRALMSKPKLAIFTVFTLMPWSNFGDIVFFFEF